MLLLLLFHPAFSLPNSIDNLNLPEPSLKYHIQSRQDLRESCEKDDFCRENITRGQEHCYGFETSCDPKRSYSKEISKPVCRKGTDLKRVNIFYDQADFGYLRERQHLLDICISKELDKSELKCSRQLLYCTAKNIFFDLSNLNAKKSKRYRENVIQQGQVGGNCHVFHQNLLESNQAARGYLSSWSDELKHFESDPTFAVDDQHCDVIFERPTIIIKLDAQVNMYHHFCDFINLYASQHINKSFDQDVDVVWWDTDPNGYIDNMFGVVWNAFTNRKSTELVSLDGKKVCFKNAMFSLLARQAAGLFYNMPLIHECQGSSLVHAFRSHLLHRLKIEESIPDLQNLRITILSRSTQFRRFLNLNEMFKSASSIPNVTVRVVDYNAHMPFEKQINSTVQTDIFVGIHGAGLTHLLFLPDWAAVFEVYHCEDRGCYSDLARLRGVKYFTWADSKVHLLKREGKHPTKEGDHRKFANYRIDAPVFVDELKKIVEYVRRNPKFVAARRKLRRENSIHREL